MKLKNRLLFSLSAGTCLFWSYGYSLDEVLSYSFNIPTNGQVNTNDISVEGFVSFNLTQETIVFDVTNTSADPSEISGVFLLAPFDLDVSTTTFSFTPDQGTTGNSRWEPVNSMTQSMFASLPTSGAKADYLGATVQSQSSVDTIASSPANEQTIFTFSVSGLNAFTTQQISSFYGNSDQSLLAFRWQSIEDNNATSAKGYGGMVELDIPVIPVPEPSQVAALSMAGLAGLLFIRRRIKSKRAQKS